jgi:WD40 repeat protein
MFGGTIQGAYFIEGQPYIIALAGSTAVVFDTTNGTELWRKRKEVGQASALRRLAADTFLADGVWFSAKVTWTGDAFQVTTIPQCPRPEVGLGQITFGCEAVLEGGGTVRSAGTRIVLSDASGGNERRINAHTQTISEVAGVPSTNFVMTGSWDGTVAIWDATTGNLAARSGLLRGGARRLLASNGGDRIVVLNLEPGTLPHGGGVSVWEFHPPPVLGPDPFAPPMGPPPMAHGPPPPPPAPNPNHPPPPIPPQATVCWSDTGSPVLSKWTGTALVEDPAASVFGFVSLIARRDCTLLAVRSDSQLGLFKRTAQAWTKLGEITFNGALHGALAEKADVLAWTEMSGEVSQGTFHTLVRAWAPPALPETLLDTKEMAMSVAVSSDGARVAAYTMDGAVRVWERASHTVLLERTHPMGTPAELSFDVRGDGHALIVPTGIGVEVWKFNGTTQTIPLNGITSIHTYQASADGSIAVVVGRRWADDVARLLVIVDGATLQPLAQSLLPRRPGGVWISPRANSLLVGYPGLKSAFETFGFDQSMDRNRVRRMTGQRFTSAGIVPDP